MALQIAESFTGPGVRHDLGTLDDLYVGRDVRTVSTDNRAIAGIGSGHLIQIAGSVYGYSDGLFLGATDTSGGSSTILIDTTGNLAARYDAIKLTGTGNSIINKGEISSGKDHAINFTYSPYAPRPANTVTNYGAIMGFSTAISSEYALTLKNHGDIGSIGDTAIALANGNDRLVNYGRIDGAISLDEGSNTLLNRGMIDGDITAGSGIDKVDNRGGIITGTITLGAGDDYFTPGTSEETVYAGLGEDTLDFRFTSGVTFALDGSVAAVGAAIVNDTYSGFEDLVGSQTGADVLIGDRFNNSIEGRGGNDRLIGGGGQDRLVGGLGADTFAFARGDTTANSLTADSIADFNSAQRDRIDISAIDANTKVAGEQAFTFIGAAAFGNVAGQLRFEYSAGNTLVQGDVNGDGKADFLLVLFGQLALKAADFVL